MRKCLLMHARPHVAGIDEHGRDAAIAELSRQRARQELQRRLAGAVRSPAGIGALRRVARDVHDEPATFGKQRDGELNQRDRRAGVDREDAAEALHVEVQQRADAAELRRVVHEHVQAAELRAPRPRAARAQMRPSCRPATGHDPRPRAEPAIRRRRASGSAIPCADDQVVVRVQPARAR